MTENSIVFETPQINELNVTINGVANNKPESITWNWGDDVSSTSWFPASHTYSQNGTYTITASANYINENDLIDLGVSITTSVSTSTTITISSSGSTSTSTSSEWSISPNQNPYQNVPYSTSSSTSTTTSSDTIMQFVYYYPPIDMVEKDISGIGSDGRYGFVLVNLDLAYNFVNFIAFTGNSKTEQIVLTPDAFTNWYDNNISSLAGNTTLTFQATSLESPVNGYNNAEAQTEAYIEKLGYYWKPYEPSYTTNYNVAVSALDPVKLYGFPSTELYMLIAPAGSTSTTTSNQEALLTQTDQNEQAIQYQNSQNNQNNQNNSNNNTPPTTPPSPPPNNPFDNIELDAVLGVIGVIIIVGVGYFLTR